MADRVLTWFIAGGLHQNVVGTNVSTEYVLDDDYVPVKVYLRQKAAQSGNPTVVDINVDGESIFDTVKPSVNQGLLTTEWDVFDPDASIYEAGSVVTLDVDSVSVTVPGSDLSVSLELDKI